MPKKKVIEQFEAKEEVPTQELAAAYIEELKAPPAHAKKKAAVYIAVKEFELDGETYQEGDEVVLPASYKRDTNFESFRGSVGKRGIDTQQGLAFSQEGEVVDKKTQERAIRLMILPLREA